MVDATRDVSAWILAGGEGRRMGGQDKGLVCHRGRPLVVSVMQVMAPHVERLHIIANRNQDQYRQLATQTLGAHEMSRWQVVSDDADLPSGSGPMAGILTALRHSHTEWLWFSPCDTPSLPNDLIFSMMRKAQEGGTDAVVATTQESPQSLRHHWLCCLINKRVCPDTEAVFVKGERKIGQWIQSLRWRAVCFPDAQAFMNINTPETPHGRD